MIINVLRMIAANSGILESYKTDLDHDETCLRASCAGQRYVWILRQHGTELFPLNCGRNPVWATYWLDPKNERRAPEYLTRLITVTADGGFEGTIDAITHDQARAYVAEPCAKDVAPVESPFYS